jgi:hypothetical protein
MISLLLLKMSSPYDWGAGVYVYIISLSLLFLSTIVMEVRIWVCIINQFIESDE